MVYFVCDVIKILYFFILWVVNVYILVVKIMWGYLDGIGLDIDLLEWFILEDI